MPPPRGLTVFVQFPEPPATRTFGEVTVAEAVVMIDDAPVRTLALEPHAQEPRLAGSLDEPRGRSVEYAPRNYLDLSTPWPPAHWPALDFLDEIAAAGTLSMRANGPSGVMTADFPVTMGVGVLDTVRTACR